ncbi:MULTISPECIES: NAD(P)-dependent oxidoreductase [unclassified Caballeronia]|uniref:NAD(P)-dependent oxidoreductase n=1 Tax=unclassified Caballeronia TaxID=2646786 RepID=UPI001F2CBF19|nr:MULTISPECIES: NAD(P)-dependent oxidoreductase [unclassified Caballeronia]MCE4546075.1 NAD(P)-dependent oxidoreductase [Caballeronia sp. PC1]MCE4573452.1 NAD(P)-dependent oxidoreductase [Caballeronia sp. CLC5]
MNIMWIGYGKMGEPMARRVARSGNALGVVDTSAPRRNAAREHGFAVSDLESADPGDFEVIVTSLPNDAAVLLALTAKGGVLDKARPGTTLIETSTISVEASSAIAKVAAARQIGYVRAPVSGSIGAAGEGTLTTFMSGPAEASARARTVAECYASTVIEVGDAEQARVMKLAINLMVTTLVASLGEAYVLCTKGGIAPEHALDAIGASAIGSPHLRFKAAALARRDFSASFTVAQMRKDLRLIAEGARTLNAPVLLGATVDQVMACAEASGYGEEDYLACVKVIAHMAGIAV